MSLIAITVYAGHDNEDEFFVVSDYSAIDLSTLTMIGFEVERPSTCFPRDDYSRPTGSVDRSFDSVNEASLFELVTSKAGNALSTGHFTVQFGLQFTDSDLGDWEARMVLYDAVYTNGVRHGKPFRLVVQK